jgi:hypothetical protein
VQLLEPVDLQLQMTAGTHDRLSEIMVEHDAVAYVCQPLELFLSVQDVLLCKSIFQRAQTAVLRTPLSLRSDPTPDQVGDLALRACWSGDD